MASNTVFRFLILLASLVWILADEKVARGRRESWTNGSWFKTVIVGQIHEYGGQVRKVFEKEVEKVGIPLLKRDEEIVFEYPHGDQRIKGIAIKDLENGLAEPSVTRGGLGFNFVNIKLKSERGSGYKFLIEIYA